MSTAFGNSVVSSDTVKVWYWKLKNKDNNIQEAGEFTCHPPDSSWDLTVRTCGRRLVFNH